eukprot:UN25685
MAFVAPIMFYDRSKISLKPVPKKSNSKDNKNPDQTINVIYPKKKRENNESPKIVSERTALLSTGKRKSFDSGHESLTLDDTAGEEDSSENQIAERDTFFLFQFQVTSLKIVGRRVRGSIFRQYDIIVLHLERQGNTIQITNKTQFVLSDIIHVLIDPVYLEKVCTKLELSLFSLDCGYLMPYSANENRMLVKSMVGTGCRLLGQSIEQAESRSLYNSYIVGIKPRYISLEECTEQIRQLKKKKIRTGDMLCMSTEHTFIEHFDNSEEYPFIQQLQQADKPSDLFHIWYSGIILVSLITLVATSTLDLFTASLSALFLLCMGGCITVEQIFRAIKLRTILTIVGTFGIGAAFKETGVANVIATA